MMRLLMTRRAARGRRADFARKIGADYSRRWPNCNVAGSPFHLGEFWPFGLPALARPAKGRPATRCKHGQISCAFNCWAPKQESN
jgi:hypothetical protein